MQRQTNTRENPVLTAISEDVLDRVRARIQAPVAEDKEGTYLQHYGTPRHSGRYPWGSGENPYQSEMDFQAHVKSLRDKGWSQKEIAKSMQMNTSQLRAKIDIASENIARGRNAEIFRLRDKGYRKSAIAKQMGIPESTVRNVLKRVDEVNENATRSVAETLKKAVTDQKYIDVGHGCESQMGISKEKLRHAVALAEQEGYEIQYHDQIQMGTGKTTKMKILVPKGTPWGEVERAKRNAEISFPGFHFEHNDYENPHKLESPTSVSSKRIIVAYPNGKGDDTDGAAKDGLIEIRPGWAQFLCAGTYRGRRFSLCKRCCRIC